MINFFNITDRENQEYYEAVEAYKAGTADDLQLKDDELHKKMDSGNSVIIMAKQNVMPAFMAMLWKLEGTNFIVNEVISLIPSFKDFPFGKMYFDVLKHSEYYQNNHIIFEVEDPEFGDKAERIEKINYYFKYGFQLLKGIKTFVPDPQSEDYENTLLMVLTQNRFHEFNKDEISEMIIKMYKDLYHIDADAFVLEGILENIPEKIELTGKYE